MTATGASMDPGRGSVAEGLLAMVLVVSLALVAAGYGRGVHELWARRGLGRVVPVWRVVAFGAGLLVVLAAQGGPVHERAEGSFAGHMAQHMLLLLLAGPLLAAGVAGLPVSLVCSVPLRRRLARWRVTPAARWLRRPTTYALLAGGAQTLVLWIWHLPTTYVAALEHPVVHAVEHLCFVGSAWLLWTPVVGSPRHRPPAPVAVLLLLGTMLPASALGAVLTFAPEPVYPAQVFGTDPLADQQLAGLLMWAPMDVAVLVATLAMFLRWLLQRERLDADRSVPASGDRWNGDPAVEARTERLVG
ncbi:Cytochrome c oxidase assembly factor CtaG [Micromonospora rhizosphaerae]|uniref:Cytochrome c oxidase assembly factor CtaG n=1 Tax=Micromonospora rhizosphaerae TaxID=568872 RepID=A0A1C6STJ9_9ACTN|nr:cytochrome c oxidase assembly protein [Micromonospora rhizosphaerae]SCL32851.1 Cytochrome c oxidase assembly factor CtaG [Micromonospora rhizosphaerae]